MAALRKLQPSNTPYAEPAIYPWALPYASRHDLQLGHRVTDLARQRQPALSAWLYICCIYYYRTCLTVACVTPPNSYQARLRHDTNQAACLRNQSLQHPPMYSTQGAMR